METDCSRLTILEALGSSTCSEGQAKSPGFPLLQTETQHKDYKVINSSSRSSRTRAVLLEVVRH